MKFLGDYILKDFYKLLLSISLKKVFTPSCSDLLYTVHCYIPKSYTIKTDITLFIIRKNSTI